MAEKFRLGAGVWNTSDSVLENVSQPQWVDEDEIDNVDRDISNLISRLEREMHQAADRLDFERAANLRDRIFKLQNATN